jgi:hypothetical protein
MIPRRIVGVLLIIFAGLSQAGIVDFERLPLPPFSQRVELVDAWFVIIEESGERPAYLSTIDSDMSLRDEMKKLGVRYLRLDKDSTDAEPYRDRAMSHGLPAYLLINGNSKVISEGALPQTRDAVLAIVRQQ